MDIQKEYNRIVVRMLDHVENGTTDQAADTMTVPVSGYTDPDTWQQEMDLIFKRVPLLVGLSIEIPNPGDYKTIDMLDRPLLITRLKDGSVRAMLNVCSHRAMLVANEESGNRSVFTCPYHGWSFANDGCLRGVAGPDKFGDVDKESLGLTQLPVYERGGFIFAVLTPGLAVDFDGFLGGMIEDIEGLNFQDWYFCGKRDIFGANWKVAYDGYLEGYHFASAHPDTIHPRSFSNIMDFSAYGPHIRIGFPQRSIAKLRDVPVDELWQHENDGYDFIRLLFPNVSIFVAPEITSISVLIPGPTYDKNRTIQYFVHREGPVNDKAKADIETMMDWLQAVVDKEDYQVGIKVQRGLESGAHKQLVFGRNERGNQYFHKWVNYYLADDHTAPKPVL